MNGSRMFVLDYLDIILVVSVHLKWLSRSNFSDLFTVSVITVIISIFFFPGFKKMCYLHNLNVTGSTKGWLSFLYKKVDWNRVCYIFEPFLEISILTHPLSSGSFFDEEPQISLKFVSNLVFNSLISTLLVSNEAP